MKTAAFWTVVISISLLGGSCASGGKSRDRGPGAERATQADPAKKQALFPRIVHEMPPSGVLDLGPVVVSGRAGGLDSMAILQDVAERIGADAFVLEERKVGEAYPVQTKIVGGFVETFDGRTYQVSTYVVRPAGQGGGIRETGFYRAIRFVEGEPGPCRLDEDKLADEVLNLFKDVATLREQIRRLTVLFAQGIIDAETFRSVRKSCLDQMR